MIRIGVTIKTPYSNFLKMQHSKCLMLILDESKVRRDDEFR
jgi:hypothetical protein